ncbi:uncharacterized, partial [Tachysurus ichikawai]
APCGGGLHAVSGWMRPRPPRNLSAPAQLGIKSARAPPASLRP